MRRSLEEKELLKIYESIVMPVCSTMSNVFVYGMQLDVKRALELKGQLEVSDYRSFDEKHFFLQNLCEDIQQRVQAMTDRPSTPINMASAREVSKFLFETINIPPPPDMPQTVGKVRSYR